MNLIIERCDGGYRATASDLPGSPPIGTGRSPEEAVAILFARLAMYDNGIWLEHWRTALLSSPSLAVVSQPPADRAVALLAELTDDERVRAFKDHFCSECGRILRHEFDHCSCWNDE